MHEIRDENWVEKGCKSLPFKLEKVVEVEPDGPGPVLERLQVRLFLHLLFHLALDEAHTLWETLSDYVIVEIFSTIIPINELLVRFSI